jgi:excisionase family DNA binding protein
MVTMKRLPKKILTPTEPIPAGEQLLDPKGVGQRLKLSPRTVSEMANDGRLPAYRIGIYLRFKWAEVEQHIAATCRVPRGPIEKTISTPHPDPLPARGGEGIKSQRRGA